MKKVTRRTALSMLCAAVMGVNGLLAGSVMANTGNYPDKSIRVVVPYPAGGGTDTIARMISNELATELGTTVWVENKPGASGTIGNQFVAKSAPDGYTVLLGITALVQAPWLYKSLPYEVSELTPVSQVALSSDVFVVNKDIPVNTMEEFIAHVKKNPSKYSYGSYGNGTSSHLHGEQYKVIHGLDLMHIPYKGSGPEVTAMLSGELTSAFIDITAISPHLKSDKFKILGVTGSKRLTSLPDARTFSEMGMDGFNANGWFGFFVPAGTPEPVVNLLSEKIQKVMKMPKINGRLVDMGLIPVGNSAADYAKIFKDDLAEYGKVVKETGIRMD